MVEITLFFSLIAPSAMSFAKNRDFTSKSPPIMRENNPKLRLIANFQSLMVQSLERIESDIANDPAFCSLFEIAPETTIERIEVLGDETHTRGKLPLCFITLNTGQRIVYKPRSTLSELLICGNEESTRTAYGPSLFLQQGLKTYKVYNKNDQNYGYCEFLENIESENTFESTEELKAFYEEYAKIECAARMIGLGDLHRHNIIVSRKRPYLIDTEVVGLPTTSLIPVIVNDQLIATVPAFSTCLFSRPNPGALTADDRSKNHFWLTDDFIINVLHRSSELQIRAI